MLRSIVYVSEMASEFSGGDVDSLVALALAHNERVEISGILFCFSDRFIQVLEGPGPAVGELYGRIRLDPRHHDIVTVQDVPVDERAYGDWGMRRITNEDLTETERALMFQALRVFDRRRSSDQKCAPRQSPSAFSWIESWRGRFQRNGQPQRPTTFQACSTLPRLSWRVTL